MRSIVALVSIALSAAPAMADEPIVLTSSTAWQLDYADDKCRLIRVFGDGDDKALFIIDKDSPGKRFEWTVASRLLTGFREERDFSATFGPAFEPVVEPVKYLTFKDYGQALIGSGYKPFPKPGKTPPSTAETVADTQSLAEVGAQIGWFEVAQGKRTVRFNLGNMGDAFTALSTCSDDLLASWGLDPDKLDVHTPPKMTNLPDVARKLLRRYPIRAEEAGLGGIFNMKLSVDENGKILWCKMIARTEPEGFDDSPCQILKQYLIIEPARDVNGKPMKSLINSAITYSP